MSFPPVWRSSCGQPFGRVRAEGGRKGLDASPVRLADVWCSSPATAGPL